MSCAPFRRCSRSAYTEVEALWLHGTYGRSEPHASPEERRNGHAHCEACRHCQHYTDCYGHFVLPIHPLCVVAWNTAHGRAHADVFTSLTAYEVPLLLLYCLCRCGGFRACVRAFACAHTRVYAACLRVRVCVCVHVRMNLSQWLAQREPPFISSNAVGWSRTRHYQHGTCTHTPTISLPAYGTPGRNARPSLLHRVARESAHSFVFVRL